MELNQLIGIGLACLSVLMIVAALLSLCSYADDVATKQANERIKRETAHRYALERRLRELNSEIRRRDEQSCERKAS